jgi:2-oxoglutarate/2-oxoacid ferredoxin oxidoreductase subunit alpha
MHRVSLKIAGAQGQGVNSVGEMCAKGLKRGGYCVFGYREYMSLIKGGKSSYQLDISAEQIRSTEEQSDILVAFDHYSLDRLDEVKDGGLILHQTPQWKFSPGQEALLQKRNITVLYLPTEEILKKINAKPVLGNVLITSVVWALIGRDKKEIRQLVEEQFGHKKDLLELNFSCIDEGFSYHAEHASNLNVALPDPEKCWEKQLLVTGSESMGLGIIHSGCRVFAGYPMTPASPLLTFLADMQVKTHMIIKQAEDEITAAQMVVGAMHAGTRAATGTSGGGYDLMTETISLCGISETPAVFILAQRPGPATGLPTWTAQGDLLLAVHSAHGEFPRLILSVSDSEDCFRLMSDAFNFAEEYQIPVTVMTEKQTAEALFTQEPFDQKGAEVRRGKLVTENGDLQKLQGSDRYNPTVEDGISSRWLPGAEAATYCAQSYEHTADGSFSETSENAKEQAEKRMRKIKALKSVLPEPELYQVVSDQWSVISGDSVPEFDLLVVGWGSTKGVIADVLQSEESQGKNVGYLHYTYLWPLKTDRFVDLAKKVKKTVLVEGNSQGQLGMLLKQECGVDISEKILKYDGRPFFYDELSSLLTPYL